MVSERDSGTARLEEAVSALDAALTVFVSAHANYYAVRISLRPAAKQIPAV